MFRVTYADSGRFKYTGKTGDPFRRCQIRWPAPPALTEKDEGRMLGNTVAAGLCHNFAGNRKMHLPLKILTPTSPSMTANIVLTAVQ